MLKPLTICLLCAVPALGQARYRKDGPAVLPDARYTPGSVRKASVRDLCPHADTKAVRHVTEAEKKAACREYGIPAAKCTGKNYEIDHSVSLELGGDNSLQNLWPEPEPQAREMKDKVENWTHAQVCSGKMALPEAQRQIARDWYVLWQQMENQ